MPKSHYYISHHNIKSLDSSEIGSYSEMVRSFSMALDMSLKWMLMVIDMLDLSMSIYMLML